MKILITHVYSNDNKGDAAILSVLVSDVRKTFPKSNVSILTFKKVRQGEKFDGVRVYQSFMGHALCDYDFKPLKLIHSFYIIFITLLAALLNHSGISLPLGKKIAPLFNLYREADLVICVGGGYLRGQTGIISTIELALQLHPLLLSRLLEQKTVLYSQSIGPFGNSFQKKLAAATLPHADLILARENITVNILKNMGITNNVARSIDAAFAFNEGTKLNLHRLLNIPSSQKIVGITVRKWLKNPEQLKFEKSIAALADFFVSRGYAVVFIPQVTSPEHNDDDRIAGRDVFSWVKRKDRIYKLEIKFNHREIKSLYSNLDLLVGTRFHSVIFALTSFVPVLAIEYEHKTTGIMSDLGLRRWVISIEDVTAGKLLKLAKDLLSEQQKYRASLKKNLPYYIERSGNASLLLKKVAGYTR